MTFIGWFFKNIILKNPTLQYIARLDDSIKWRAVASEMGKLKSADPSFYIRLKEDFEKEKDLIIPHSNDVDLLKSKDLERQSYKDLQTEIMDKEHRKSSPRSYHDLESEQLYLFGNPKVSTLLRALKKVSNAG